MDDFKIEFAGSQNNSFKERPSKSKTDMNDKLTNIQDAQKKLSEDIQLLRDEINQIKIGLSSIFRQKFN